MESFFYFFTQDFLSYDIKINIKFKNCKQCKILLSEVQILHKILKKLKSKFYFSKYIFLVIP